MYVTPWQTKLCLTHLVLKLITEEGPRFISSDELERANGLLERLERLSYFDDQEEGEQTLEMLIACEDNAGLDDVDAFEDEHNDNSFITGEYLDEDDDEDEPPMLVPDSPDSWDLLEAMGLQWHELVEAVHCFDRNAMCFGILKEMNEACSLISAVTSSSDLERLVDTFIKHFFSNEESKDLLELWDGFASLEHLLLEETAFQWLLAADFLTAPLQLGQKGIPTAHATASAIADVHNARATDPASLSEHYASALWLLEARVLEAARVNAPDNEFEIELFDMMGGSLNCNFAASEMPKAVRAYLRLLQAEA